VAAASGNGKICLAELRLDLLRAGSLKAAKRGIATERDVAVSRGKCVRTGSEVDVTASQLLEGRQLLHELAHYERSFPRKGVDVITLLGG
jgi:hypothetical protein